MNKLLYMLGFVWLLPATILVWSLYIIPIWALGYIELVKFSFPAVQFKLKATDNWYAKLWKTWWGFSAPCAYIYKDTSYIQIEYVNYKFDNVWVDSQVSIIRTHELRHCWQQYILGALYYPTYMACSIVLWLYGSITNADVHAYHDNPFERDAKRFAGQKIKIPRSEWMNGPNDRIPWI